MDNKRGSHVGMMLSFAIFITFITFLYFAVEPGLRVGSDEEFLLSSVQVKLLDMFYDDIKIITISNTTIQGPLNCIQVDSDDVGLLGNVSVRNNKNELVVSNMTNDYLYLNWNGEPYFKIYISTSLIENAETTNSGCTPNYKIESIVEDLQISESKIIEVVEEYTSNYDTLRNELGLITEENFGFDFYDGSENLIIGTSDSIDKFSVYAERIPVNYFNTKGEVLSGSIVLRVWRK